jgi:hypothetical protein
VGAILPLASVGITLDFGWPPSRLTVASPEHTAGVADTVSSVSGGGVSDWEPATSVDFDSGDGEMLQFFYGVVSSTGSHAITINLSGSVNTIQLDDEELSAGTSPTWSIDTSGSETSGDFPSLSTARSGDAYVGIQYAWGTGASGGTSGVDYDVVSSNFVVATATGVSGTISPGGTGAGAVALLVSARRLGGWCRTGCV